jgi:cholest-4-en-3-one 26-monooxygenase
MQEPARAGLSPDDCNLTDPLFFATGDPEALYARLRREDPVHWTQGRLSRGFWSVTTYKDARQVYSQDKNTFSMQESGNVLPPHPDFDDPANSEALRLTRGGVSLSGMDGTPHTELRKAFAVMFDLPNVTKIESLVRQLCVEIINDVLPKGYCDFATDVAAKLPLMVIAKIMNVPRKDWDDLYRWANMHSAPDDPEFSIGNPVETYREGLTRINEYCLSLALERRKSPGEDLISLMAGTHLDGAPLSDERLAYNGLMFFVAGHDTTRNTLCSGLEILCKSPQELERLRALRRDRKALEVAVEEFVRWATPVNHQLRTAMEDTRLGIRDIRAGELVVVWNLSANRDESVFSDAGRFDCRRSPNAHLGFGMGKHFCLGVHLARLEMRTMLGYLLEHLHDIDMIGQPKRAVSNLFRGVNHMPIRFRPSGPIAN